MAMRVSPNAAILAAQQTAKEKLAAANLVAQLNKGGAARGAIVTDDLKAAGLYRAGVDLNDPVVVSYDKAAETGTSPAVLAGIGLAGIGALYILWKYI